MRALLCSLLTVALIAALLPTGADAADGGPAAVQRVYRFWPKSAVVDAASIHASKYLKHLAPYLLYFDLGDTAPEQRGKKLQGLSAAFNSLVSKDVIVLPGTVLGTEGAVAYFDFSRTGIQRKQLDRLGQLGGGPAPFPEPFFHVVVTETVTEEVSEPYAAYEDVLVPDGYGRYVTQRRAYTAYKTVAKTRKVKKVALAPHLNRATVLGLVALTGTDFPVFNADWFLSYALTEPRYHELQNLDDTQDSFEKLAGVNKKLSLLRGSSLRSAVLFSEPGLRNRFLDRFPTDVRYGDGSWHESSDYATSVNKSDVLKHLTNPEADANEVVYSLPNGLHGYGIFVNRKRIDVAAPNIAQLGRGKWKDHQVYGGVLSCAICHWPDNGYIEVDDEVRALSLKPVKLLVDALKKGGKGGRAEEVRQRYLAGDYNVMVRKDQQVFRAAMTAATRNPHGESLTPAEAARVVTESARVYLEEPVTLQRFAQELGYPQDEVLAALRTEGLDPSAAVLAAGRKARRDQVELLFGQVATVLYAGKYKGVR